MVELTARAPVTTSGHLVVPGLPWLTVYPGSHKCMCVCNWPLPLQGTCTSKSVHPQAPAIIAACCGPAWLDFVLLQRTPAGLAASVHPLHAHQEPHRCQWKVHKYVEIKNKLVKKQWIKNEVRKEI